VATQAAFLFVDAVTPPIIGSCNLLHAAARRQRSGQQRISYTATITATSP